MNRRFLLLSNMYPSSQNPSKGVFVKNIEQALLNSGVDVKRVVLAGRYESYLLKAVHYLAYIIRAFLTLLVTDRVVYIHYVAHSAIPFILASTFRNLPLVAHVHGGDVLPPDYQPGWVTKLKLWFAKKTLQKADKVIVPSLWFKNFVVSEYKLDRDKINVNPSGGVDTKKFIDKNRPDPFYIHNNKLKLGYVGRLDAGKGVETMLKALASLEVEFHCDVVGTGSYYDEFKELAKTYNIADKVTFHGVKDQKQLPEFYSSFDYFIFPSERQESLGLVGLEAMACGTPVIGTLNAGMADYVKDGINGFGYCPGDAESLTQCLIKAYGINSEQYIGLSRAAREMAVKFDAKTSNQNLLYILK